MFKFSPANTKLKKLNEVYRLRKYNAMSGRKIYSFDMLSGWSCPGANECLCKVKEVDGTRKVEDGKNTKFRCFSASQEALYDHVYKLRKNNFDFMRQLKSESYITEELLKVLPKNIGILRFNVAGDIFTENQFLAYCNLARENKETIFYGYTKSLRILTKLKDKMPSNFRLLASMGGRYDSYISKYDLPYSQVVLDKKEAKRIGLPIDYDDSHAVFNKSCALLIHGIQPKNSEASKALQLLKSSK